MNLQKGSTTLIVIGVIFGLVLLGVLGTALNLITIPWLKFNKQVQMNRDIVTKTYSADNALYNYHWFKEKAESIKATEQMIGDAELQAKTFDTTAGTRSNWTFEDKQESARLNAVLAGLKNFYHTQVAEYNARAQEADRAIFQDDLPLFFNLNAY